MADLLHVARELQRQLRIGQVWFSVVEGDGRGEVQFCWFPEKEMRSPSFFLPLLVVEAVENAHVAGLVEHDAERLLAGYRKQKGEGEKVRWLHTCGHRVSYVGECGCAEGLRDAARRDLEKKEGGVDGQPQ